MDAYKILDTLHEHLDAARKAYSDKGFTPFFIGLYGSQNYGLDTENSDIDSKCMVIPDLHHLIFDKKRLSTDLEVGGALCNIKDLREMCDNFYKGNPNFIEILYTPHLIYDGTYHTSVCKLLMGRDKIANRDPVNLMKMCAAMAKQKYVAFDKPFESKKEILAQYSYDPKQLFHLCRLYFFMQSYLETGDFRDYFHPSIEQHKFLMRLKTNPVSYPQALPLRDDTMELIDELYDKAKVKFAIAPEEQEKKNAEVRKILDDFCLEVINEKMKENYNAVN